MQGVSSEAWATEVVRALEIVLVDDDPDDQVLTGDMLRQALGDRVRITAVGSYEEALALLRTRPFDIGLVDLQLGVHSGLELVQALGGREALTPLILLTGMEADDADQQALQVGAYDFLNKGELAPRSLSRSIRYASHSHQLERKLHGALRDAQSATRAKSEFLARMSHDLRTPLNAILGFSEIIKDEMFGKVGVPAYAGYAQDIHGSALQLLDLINDILDLSRVEADQLRLSVRRLPLHEIADDVVRLVRPTANARGIEVALEASPEVLVLADERALRRMLSNLLSNALKFTPSGGRVTIYADDRADATEVAVSDTGIGIAPAHLQAVRAPFAQVDSDIMTTQSGSGLGLAIVESLMKAHRGRLELDSEIGAGTTARLIFPTAGGNATGAAAEARGRAA